MRHRIFGVFVLLAMVLGAGHADAACWNWVKSPTSSNGNADPTINFQEGQAPSSVNDSARALMARLAECRDDLSGVLQTAGGAVAFTVTTNQGLNAVPVDGQSLAIRLNVTNGAASTLAADGGTAYAIQTAPGVAVSGGVLVAGTPYRVTFNLASTAWVLQDFYSVSIPANSITTAMIQDADVTYAKMQNVTAARLLGNPTGGAAAPSEISVTGPLAFSGVSLTLGATNTAHGVAIFEGTAAMGNAGPGTLGQSLVSNGASADPSFKSGGWSLLSTLNAIGTANLDDTTNITNAYNDYELVFENLIPSNAGVSCMIQVQVAGTFQTSGYSSTTGGATSGVFSASSPSTFIPCTRVSALNNFGSIGVSGSIKLFAGSGGVSGTSVTKGFVGQTIYPNSGSTAEAGFVGGYLVAASAITGIRVTVSAGTWNGGSVKIYGRL